MTPTIGRIVHVLVDPSTNNGSDVAPAVIARVWDEVGDHWVVNYRILLDERETPWVTSAYLYANEQSARSGTAAPPAAAFWPPRV